MLTLFVTYVRTESLAMAALSLTIHSVANPRAHELMPSAPFTPKYLTNKKTLTTKILRGIPNKFMMTDRCESGMYLLRKVPMEGKYIPTHASKAKKEAINAGRPLTADADETVYVAVDIATVATASIPVVTPSVVGPFILAN